MEATENRTSLRDTFCDYTSVGEVREHSEIRAFVRWLSLIVLLLSVAVFGIHVSNFVVRLLFDQTSVTILTNLADDVIVPSLFVCPSSKIFDCHWHAGEPCQVTQTDNCTHIQSVDSFHKLTIYSATLDVIRFTVDTQFADENGQPHPVVMIAVDDHSARYAGTARPRKTLAITLLHFTENQDQGGCDSDGLCHSAEVVSDRFYGDETPDGPPIASVTVGFGRGVYSVRRLSSSYTFLQLAIDLGSALGLYFGFTTLTIFELAVFFLYGRSTELELRPPPPRNIIYNYPSKKALKKRQSEEFRRKLAAWHHREERLASVLPAIR